MSSFRDPITGCCGGAGGPLGCLYMTFCTPCAYADVTSEVLGKGQDDCMMHGCGLTLCCCCIPCAAAAGRIKTYEKYGFEDKEVAAGVKTSIVEAAVGFLTWPCGCCPAMMMCQERNHVLATRS